jgi:hypothetical protein
MIYTFDKLGPGHDRNIRKGYRAVGRGQGKNRLAVASVDVPDQLVYHFQYCVGYLLARVGSGITFIGQTSSLHVQSGWAGHFASRNNVQLLNFSLVVDGENEQLSKLPLWLSLQQVTA